MSEEKTGNQPEKKFSTGAISASVWKNQGTSKKTGEAVEYKTVTLQRSYKDKNDQWQHTSSLRATDLPKATLVLQKAFEYLVLKGQGSDSPTLEPEGKEVEVEDIVI